MLGDKAITKGIKFDECIERFDASRGRVIDAVEFEARSTAMIEGLSSTPPPVIERVRIDSGGQQDVFAIGASRAGLRNELRRRATGALGPWRPREARQPWRQRPTCP